MAYPRHGFTSRELACYWDNQHLVGTERSTMNDVVYQLHFGSLWSGSRYRTRRDGALEPPPHTIENEPPLSHGDDNFYQEQSCSLDQLVVYMESRESRLRDFRRPQKLWQQDIELHADHWGPAPPISTSDV